MSQLNLEERKNVREYLVSGFDLEELKHLAFDLGVSYESLPHFSKAEFCLELIDYFERRDSLALLLNEALKLHNDNRIADILARLPVPRKTIEISVPANKIEEKTNQEVVKAIAELLGIPEDEVTIVALQKG